MAHAQADEPFEGRAVMPYSTASDHYLGSERPPIDLKLGDMPSTIRYEAADAYYRKSEGSFRRDVGLNWLAFQIGLGVTASFIHGNDPAFFANLLQNSVLDPNALLMALAWVGGDRGSVALLSKVGLLYDPPPIPPIAMSARRDLVPFRTALSTSFNPVWEARRAMDAVGPTSHQVWVARHLPVIRTFSAFALMTVVTELASSGKAMACISGYGRKLTPNEFDIWTRDCDQLYEYFVRSGKAAEVASKVVATLPVLWAFSRFERVGREAWTAAEAARAEKEAASAAAAARAKQASEDATRARMAPSTSRALVVRDAAIGLGEGTASKMSFRGVGFMLGRTGLSGLRVLVGFAGMPTLAIGIVQAIAPYIAAPGTNAVLGIEYGLLLDRVIKRFDWHKQDGWIRDAPNECLKRQAIAEHQAKYGAAIRVNSPASEVACPDHRPSNEMIADIIKKGGRWRTQMLSQAAEPYYAWADYVANFQSAYINAYAADGLLVSAINAYRSSSSGNYSSNWLYRSISENQAGAIADDIMQYALEALSGKEQYGPPAPRVVSSIEHAISYLTEVLASSDPNSYRMTPNERFRLTEISMGLKRWHDVVQPQRPPETSPTDDMMMTIETRRAVHLRRAIDLTQKLIAGTSLMPNDHPYVQLKQILSDQRPLAEGEAYLRGLDRKLDGDAKMAHPTDVGSLIYTPSVMDYQLASAICGPEADRSRLAGERFGSMDLVTKAQDPGYQITPLWGDDQMVRTWWKMAWDFRAPRLVDVGRGVDLCSTMPKSQVNPSDHHISMLRSTWNVDGTDYQGFLDILKKRIRPEILGPPDSGARSFHKWWIENVVPAVERRTEDMRRQYDELVRDVILPQLNGELPHHENASWNTQLWDKMAALPFSQLFIGAVSATRPTASVVGSLRQEMTLYLDMLQSLVDEGMQASMPNRKTMPGNTVAQDMSRRIMKMREYLLLSLQLFGNIDQVRLSIAEAEKRVAIEARRELAAETQKLDARLGKRLPVTEEILDPDSVGTAHNWSRILLIASRGDYEAQAAFAWYVQAMQEQAQIMVDTMAQSYSEAKKAGDQDAMMARGYAGQYLATGAVALANEFPQYFPMIGLVRTDIVGK